jgi:hypothetical protein
MDADIVERLRKLASEFPTLDGIMDSEWTNAAAEIVRLRLGLSLALTQRDAARLEVCLLRASAGVVSASTDAEMEAYAKSRGWDFTDASIETRTDGAKRAETDMDDGA